MRITKQKILRFTLISVSIVLVLIIVLFLFRNTILQQVVSKAETKFAQEYDCDFSIKEAKFIGLSEISMTQINLIPKQADTLLSIDKIETKVNLFKIISGDIQLENLKLDKGFIQLIKNKDGKNFASFFKKKTQEQTTETEEKKDYADLAYNLISKVLNLVPENITINDFAFRFDDMGKKVNFKTDVLTLKNEQFETLLNVQTNSFTQKWSIKGLVNPRSKIADLIIKNNDTTKIRLPYIDEKFKLPTSFDNLHLKIDNIETDFGDLHIDGSTSVENFTVNNSRISKKDVVFEKAIFNFKLLLGSDFISVTEDSEVIFNDIRFNPYFEYNTESDKVYTLKATIPKMKAQDFINSLPKGLFSHFQGMEAEGEFDYKLDFKVNLDKPWKLVFDSKFNKYGLKITKYGEANLNKLNSEFVYSAIENGKRQRSVLVGSGNSFYTPLIQISPYLQKCVLTSEDPSFMSHRGFVSEAFKQSIVKNIRDKRFARGASTISMQLVKNVFLTREKTLSRKLEEILLVYILENNRIASKERMLEVYFNVIEWGPNVYGIGEAAAFYFQKQPIDLTLKECLFLASIVPKPKKFMQQFDDLGNQKSKADRHQEFISKIMFRRGLLTPDDTIGQKTPIYISGRARHLLHLREKDTIFRDTVIVEEPMFE
ncbi:transglycosylase domain-containing protein [Flavobacterium sp.]|uniref:transglycosylase domain-containing protein n=1 Tax=Flavobacterium sp. TaxID=239 RepID=UPI00286EA6E6|nr:transglycosylase domain-containing protein [Flavobacterium sp.]